MSAGFNCHSFYYVLLLVLITYCCTRLSTAAVVRLSSNRVTSVGEQYYFDYSVAYALDLDFVRPSAWCLKNGGPLPNIRLSNL